MRLLDSAAVGAGGRALARLTLDPPMLVSAGDRFVVRDWPEQHTLAGGLVLDPDPPPPRRGRPRDPSPLAARAAAPDDPAVFVATQLRRDGLARRSALLVRSRFDAAEIEAAVGRLLAGGVVVAAGGLLASASDLLASASDLLASAGAWDEMRRRATAAVDAHHLAHPEHAGLPLADLRPVIAPAVPAQAKDLAPAAGDAVVAELCRDGFVRTSAALRRASHRPALPPRLQPAGEQLRRQLAEHPFDPPSRKDLCRSDLAHQAMKFLIAQGEVTDVAEDVALASDAYARAAAMVRTHLRAHGPATVSELKTLLASTRRVMVPLLEKLDRDGVTRRDGDRRVAR